MRPGRGALFSSADFAADVEVDGDEDGLSAALAEAERVARAHQRKYLDARDEAAAAYSRSGDARASLYYAGTGANARAEQTPRSP